MRASWAFTLLVGCGASEPVATGELGQWTAGPLLPTPRANHCSAAVGDWLLVIGGNHAGAGGFVKTDEIHAARIGDGGLGPWQLAGRTPSAVTECAATADGTSLYLLGGIYDGEGAGQVWTATLGDGGMLSPMTPLTTMPTDAVTSMEAAVRDGQLLVTDTHTPMSGDRTRTLAAPLANVSTWSSRDWGIGFRAQAQIAFSETYVYTVGGYRDPALGTLADVVMQSLEDGSVRTTTELPVATGFGEAVVVDDWLFVVGGRGQAFGAPGTSSVYAGELSADGSVVAWSELARLPMARTNHELARVGDYLVLTGGAEIGPGDDAVLMARVR